MKVIKAQKLERSKALNRLVVGGWLSNIDVLGVCAVLHFGRRAKNGRLVG
ncbi:hypothetical protein [Pseudomonas sp. MWU12-2037]|nr:hypothetical protein [Pseudomonas sp. MWU12-2037]